MNDFQGIKVGDKILFRRRYGFSSTEPIILSVERVTKTQFTAGKWRFKKKTGETIGHYTAWAYVYDPEKHDKEVADFNQSKQKESYGKLIKENYHLLSFEKTEEIAKHIAEIKKARGE